MEDPFQNADKDRVTVLLSPFRQNRDINPHSWDSKMNFWTSRIKSVCSENGIVYLDVSRLPHTLAYNGRRPQCLSQVVDDMKMTGYFQSLDDFYRMCNKSWISWSFNQFVKKPLTWGLTTFLVKPLSWSAELAFGSSSPKKVELAGCYIFIDVLTDRAEKLFRFYCEEVPPIQQYSHVVSYTDLWKTHRSMFSGKMDLDMVLLYLQRQDKCTIIMTDKGHKIIRFINIGQENKASQEVDQKIYQVKLAIEKLNQEIDELDMALEANRIAAKKFLSVKNKEMALDCLRKKKRIEKMRAQKATQVENLEGFVDAINEAHSNKMVFEALAHGNAAFQGTVKKQGLDSKRIDAIMDEVSDSFALSEEIGEAMRGSPVLGPYSEAELNDELDELLRVDSGGGEGFVSEEMLPMFPQIPVHEPGTPRGHATEAM